jgi:hypothetical protein
MYIRELDNMIDADSEHFLELQKHLISEYENYFPDPFAPKTLVVVPSLTLDAEILSKLTGHIHYEERMLCMLMLLRMPRTHIIYVSSMPIDDVIIDYYLHLLPGITGMHARKRLTMISCYDSSNRPLTAKILSRPRLLERIRHSIPAGHKVHISGFNITHLEKELSIKLNIPIYGCPPFLNYWGSKSGSREIFRRAGVAYPAGYEDLKNMDDVVQALKDLKAQIPDLRRAVVKVNEGFSGDGNAIFDYTEATEITEAELRRCLKMIATIPYDIFALKMREMGGVVEAFVEGEIKTSPSVQCRINPLQKVDVISTHDQVLGGESGQVYIGATFPADEAYRYEIGLLGYKIAEELRKVGALGRFGIDFMSVKTETGWKHYAIEINLRKGGTTHPFLMLQFLTGGNYDYEKGLYEMPNGQTRFYYATDGLESEQYKTLTPEDLIDLAICNDLHFDGTTQDGVMFHLIGALSEYGKLGVLCVGKTPEQALNFYKRTMEVLNKETEGK